jgi:hypothetical protein
MANFQEIIKTIESNVDKEVNLFDTELQTVLKKLSDLITAGAIEYAKNPLKFDYYVSEALQKSGYYDLVNSFIDDSYDKNYSEILAMFESAGLTATFTEADLASIRAVKSLDIEFFNQIGRNTATSLKADLYKYSISNMKPDEIVSNIKQSLDGTELAKYSTTYADTAISKFNQSIIDLKAQEIKDEVWIYVGVKDKKTRTFCKCVLEQKKYYTRSEANKLKNDKRREYNCRHIVSPVSKEFAIEGGYKDGGFTC